MAQKVIEKFDGLHIQANSFSEVPDGACEILHNCVISDKNVISKKRGKYTYYAVKYPDTCIGIKTFNSQIVAIFRLDGDVSSDRYGKSYIGILLGDYSDPINPTGQFSYISIDTPVNFSFDAVDYIPQFMQASGNLYFTSNEGLLKLSNTNSLVMEAGAPAALDLSGYLDNSIDSTLWFDPYGVEFGNSVNPQGISVSYKTAFSYIDSNNNLVLGSPSGGFTITNPVYEDEEASQVLEFLPDEDSTTDVPGTVAALNIEVQSINHGLSIGDLILVSDASLFTTPDNANGTWAVTVATDPDKFTFATAITAGPLHGTLTWTKTAVAEIEVPGPAGPTLVTFTTPKNHNLKVDDVITGTNAFSPTPTGFDPATTPNLNANLTVIAPVTDKSFTVGITGNEPPATTTNGTINYRLNITGTRIFVKSVNHGLTAANNTIVVSKAVTEDLKLVKTAEGTYQVSVVDVDNFYYDTIVQVPIGDVVKDVSYIRPGSPRLTVNIPDGISTNTSIGWTYRLYRTSQQLSTTGNFSDYRLIIEDSLSVSQINNKILTVIDDIPVQNTGAYLYTNPNSGGGITSANAKPPLASSLALFQKRLWMADITTREYLDFSVIDPSKLWNSGATYSNAGGSYLEIGQKAPEVNSALPSPYKVRRYYKFAGANGYKGNKIQGVNLVRSGGAGSPAMIDFVIANISGLRAINTPVKVFLSALPEHVKTEVPEGVYYLRSLVPYLRWYIYKSLDDWISDTRINVSFTPATNPIKCEIITNSYEIASATLRNWEADVVSTSSTVTIDMAGVGHTFSKGLDVYFEPVAPATWKNIYEIATIDDYSVTPTINNATCDGIFPFTITITDPNHTLSDGDQVRFFDASVFGTPANANGTYPITNVTLNSFDYIVGGSPGAGAGRVSYAYTGFSINNVDTTAGPTGQVKFREIFSVVYDNQETGPSASIRIRDWAESMVKAINTDTKSPVYANYTSSPIETPGAIRLFNKKFTLPIILRVPDMWYPNPPFANIQSTDNQVYFPSIPTTYDTNLAPVQVFSATPNGLNTLVYSQYSEVEAFPIPNFIKVGSNNDRILSIKPLTNSLIIIKEKDGIFRLTGDSPANFVVSLVDPTVQCMAEESVQLFSNNVAMLSNQGVVLINESSVEIISRKIENIVQYSLNNEDLPFWTYGLSYEKERTYFLTTFNPQGELINLVYNILTDTWSTNSDTHARGEIGPDGDLYYINENFNNDQLPDDQTVIYKERNSGQRTDFCDEFYYATVTASTPGLVEPLDQTADVVYTINSLKTVPSYGDMVVLNNPLLPNLSRQINQIKTSKMVSPQNFEVTFFNPSNILQEAFDSIAVGGYPLDVTLYKAYESEIKFSPFSAANIGLLKQFSQFQAHFRDIASVTALELSFASDTYGSSEIAQWESKFDNQTWGQFAWGCQSWGAEKYNYLGAIDADTKGLDYRTSPAPICRIYVPKLGQRSSFIQAYLKSRVAGDKLLLQGLTYSYHVDGERVSR
jgi:hypothetical protein